MVSVVWPFSLDYRVYAAGGMGLDLRPHNHLQHYDMLKDMWVSLAPMPTPRYAATSFIRGSKIYVLGKAGSVSYVCPSSPLLGHFLWEAGPVCCASPGPRGLIALPHPSGSFLSGPMTVRRGTPSPVPRDLLTLLWPPGGRQSKYAVNAFEVFDIETRSWTKFPNIPCKRAFSSFVTLDDRLYSLGGLRQGRLYRQPKFLRTMDVFDMEQGKLGTSPWLPPSLLAESATLPAPHPSGPLTQRGEPFRSLQTPLHSELPLGSNSLICTTLWLAACFYQSLFHLLSCLLRSRQGRAREGFFLLSIYGERGGSLTPTVSASSHPPLQLRACANRGRTR